MNELINCHISEEMRNEQIEKNVCETMNGWLNERLKETRTNEKRN